MLNSSDSCCRDLPLAQHRNLSLSVSAVIRERENRGSRSRQMEPPLSHAFYFRPDVREAGENLTRGSCENIGQIGVANGQVRAQTVRRQLRQLARGEVAWLQGAVQPASFVENVMRWHDKDQPLPEQR